MSGLDMLSPEIVIFANAYKCPLNTRCSDCAFDHLVDMNIQEVYRTIKALDEREQFSLVQECKVCQDEFCFKENLKASNVTRFSE
jgi:hypothetical protein